MKRNGYTVVEMIITIAVIGILASIILAAMNRGGAQGRDAERASDLQNIKAALELYRLDNGRYPVGCNGDLGWSGQEGSGRYECTAGDFITLLAPEYISHLPRDPKLNGNDSGYLYMSGLGGTEFKLVASGTVETDSVQTGDCGEGSNTLVVWGGFDSSTHSGCDLPN